MLLSIFNKKNIVELHHPPTGLTNLIFIIYRFFGLDKNLDSIMILKKLKKKILKSSVMLEVYSRAKALKPLKN